MTRTFRGPFVDYGEDLNFFVPEEKGKHDGGLSKSLFVDDTVKTPEAAIIETKKKFAPYWINSPPLLAGYVDEMGEAFLFFLSEELKGRIVLLEFIDLFQPHSLRGLPYTKEWLRRYGGAGLSVISVYNSSFGFEKNLELIAQTAHQLGIQNPLLVDHDNAVWRALENRYWPRRILFNNEQKIIADHIGAGGYQEMEQEIQAALRLLSPGLACPRLMPPLNATDEKAHELKLRPPAFFGFKRGELGNAEELSPDANEVVFAMPPVPQENTAYLSGPWLGTEVSTYLSGVLYEKGQYSGNAAACITFSGGTLYLLCSSRNYLQTDATTSIRAQIYLDSKPVRDTLKGADVKSEAKKQFITVHEPRLFEVVKSVPEGNHRLDIVLDPSCVDLFEIFAVYFMP